MKICNDNEICITVSYKKFRAMKSSRRCFLRTCLMQNSANTHLKKTNFGVVSVNFSDEIISWRRSIASFSIKICSRCYEYTNASVCNFLYSSSSRKYLSILEFLDSIDVNWCNVLDDAYRRNDQKQEEGWMIYIQITMWLG